MKYPVVDRPDWVLARLIGSYTGTAVVGARASISSAPVRSSADELKEQMDDLYKRALGGDMRAKELWLGFREREASEQLFNVEIKVVPYNIPDRSLAQIISQADPVVVDDMLDGLAIRLEMDESPHPLRELVRCVRTQFSSWAREAYGTKDVI